MVWVKIIIGAVVSFLALGGIGMVALQMSGGASQLNLGSAPGLSAEDAEALASPFTDLRQGRENLLLERRSPNTSLDEVRAGIEQMRAALPQSEYQGSRLLSWRRTLATSGDTLVGIHEHDFADHVGRTETILLRANGAWLIDGLHVNFVERDAVASPLQALLRGDPAAVTAVVLAPASAVFLLVTFWVVLFWRGLKRRWLWLLACIVGFGSWSVNLATGASGWELLSFNLFGAAAGWSGSVFDAWVVTVAAPLGALAFWLTRAAEKREETA